MPSLNGRYSGAGSPSTAEGWSIERVTQPSYMYGANGMRHGADGRLYVAQVTGSRISAIDLGTGAIEDISPFGGDIVGPDDLAFDDRGNMYATEVMDARVSVRAPDGTTRILRDDLPSANGITVYQGNRLFINECRVGGRLMEFDMVGGGDPRMLLEDIPMPNGMEVGPDGMLYFPVMGMNEIWRINPEGGSPEKVVGDLGVPDAVKFDSKGFIVSTQVLSGQVLRIDPRTGDKEVLASLDPGLDNLVFAGDRLFVSHLTDGKITEILGGGQTKPLLPGGMCWPLDLDFGDDGALYISDASSLYMLPPGGEIRLLAMLFSEGFPGNLRGLKRHPDGGLIVTTANDQVARWWPHENRSEILAEGLEELYGIAVAADGAAVVAQRGAGKVVSVKSGQVEELASGLDKPTGVVIAPDGSVLVGEAGAGRIVKIAGGRTETLVDGLKQPHGMLIRDGQLYILDVDAKTLIAFDLAKGTRSVIASGLPIGTPPGRVRKPLRGLPPFTGPQGPFAGITAAPDGTLYISADGEGSVMALRRTRG